MKLNLKHIIHFKFKCYCHIHSNKKTWLPVQLNNSIAVHNRKESSDHLKTMETIIRAAYEKYSRNKCIIYTNKIKEYELK